MNNGKPLIIVCHMPQNDPIGIRFPFRSSPPSQNEAPLDETVIQAISVETQNTEVKKDYMRQIAQPLTNIETLISDYLHFMVDYYSTTFVKARSLYMVLFKQYLSNEEYDALLRSMDRIMESSKVESKARIASGQGKWFDGILVQSDAIPPTAIQKLYKFGKNKDKGVTVSESATKADLFETDEVLDDSTDMFASQDVIDAQTKERREEMQAILDKELLEDNTEKDDEKPAWELTQNSSGLGSDLISKFYAAARGPKRDLHRFIRGAGKWVIDKHVIEKVIGWMNMIPMDTLLNFTAMRTKVEEFVSSKIGLHPGSYLYDLMNGILKKVWFIIQPMINGTNQLIKWVTSLANADKKVSFKLQGHYADVYQLLGIFVNNLLKLYINGYYHFLIIFFGLYLALYWAVLSFLLRILFGLIRVLLNLVLSRVGMSI